MNRYTITQATADVADCLRAGTDHSATTIRCAINDALDSASKAGFAVRHDYNQDAAVKRVKRMLAAPTPAPAAGGAPL